MDVVFRANLDDLILCNVMCEGRRFDID